jgi:hypothetical protein
MTAVRLSAAIMTHPSRRALADDLAASLVPEPVRIVVDPKPDEPPGLLRTSLCAWSAIEPGTTHHLVFQDDVAVAPGFLARVRADVEAHPGEALAYFANWDSLDGAAVRLGVFCRADWVETTSYWTPAQALVLPVDVARAYVRFGAGQPADLFDDIVIGRLLSAIGVTALLSIPSLVDHRELPSLARPGRPHLGTACFQPGLAVRRPLAGPPTALEAIPMLLHGRSMYACQAGRTGPWRTRRWRMVPAAAHLDALGLGAERRDAAFAAALRTLPPPMLGAPSPRLLRGLRELWLTAFAIGAESARLAGGRRAASAGDELWHRCQDGALATLAAGAGGGGLDPHEVASLSEELRPLCAEGAADGAAAAAVP